MKVSKKKWIRFRVYLVGAIYVAGLGVVLARAYQLQVLKREHLGSIARAGYEGVVKLPPKRGAIFDRQGDDLALSVEVGSIYAHPKRVSNKANVAARLSKILDVRKGEVLSLLNDSRSFVWMKRRVPPEQAKQVEQLGADGLGVVTETRRYYPGKEIAAHLIGFAGDDNQGLEGLEKKYEEFLSGPQYRLIQMRDALGRPFSLSEPVQSENKRHDIILTIDRAMQYSAQHALKAAVEKSRAKGGHCVIVEPETGAILAMAVVPEFNPNIFLKYSPEHWRNRCITDVFEPGSTIKAFLLAACLEEGIVTPHTMFDCEHGRYVIDGHVIHDTHEYDLLSVWDIVMLSSNIGAVKLGQKLGYPKFHAYLEKFGFGRKTGVDLLGEREGFLRPPEEAKHIEQANAFFGQGLTTTSLQLTMAMAAIANGGNLMRPYVVRAITDESGRVVRETGPEIVRRVFSRRTAKKVAQILEDVASEDGTGSKAAIDGFRVAGKTGTAQKVDATTRQYSSSKYVSTFVGFAPAEDPKLVILAMIDEPEGQRYGGLVAGPVFREVGQWCLNHLRINPSIRVAEADKGIQSRTARSSSPTPALEKAVSEVRNDLKLTAGLLPDFRGLTMREVLREGETLGIKVALEGTGFAFKQDPGPGFPLQQVKTVKVTFKSSR
jgi:cell division protein FtsI (penicillin-binding protein 3)